MEFINRRWSITRATHMVSDHGPLHSKINHDEGYHERVENSKQKRDVDDKCVIRKPI